jgi:hypothetical protein
LALEYNCDCKTINSFLYLFKLGLFFVWVGVFRFLGCWGFVVWCLLVEVLCLGKAYICFESIMNLEGAYWQKIRKLETSF